MRRGTFRKAGLIAFALLTLLAEVSAWSGAAWAEGGESASYTPPVSEGIISLDRFNVSPDLLRYSSNVSENVASLLKEGANPERIANVLSTIGIPNAGSESLSYISQQNWQSTLQNLNSNSGLGGAATLVNGLITGTIKPDLGMALSAVNNLGNITGLSGMQNLLQLSSIRGALSALPAIDQGFAVDNILRTALNAGNLSQFTSSANLAALAASIGAAAPELMARLGGQAGLEAALGGALGSLQAGTLAAGIGGFGAAAINPPTFGGCDGCAKCQREIPEHHRQIKTEITNANTYIKNTVTTEFQKYRTWLETDFWRENILKAMMLMAEQLTTTGILQVEMIGTFLDAKHQLEVQRSFQQKQAQAISDYQPSEGMCTIGTGVRSLAGSERKSDLAQTVFANRMMQRQARSGDVVSTESEDSDIRSRAKTFISTYCDQADNGNGLTFICPTAVPRAERRNIDINYTRNIESRLTLDTDFSPAGSSDVTDDEQDVFALSANLFSHTVVPHIQPEIFGTKDGKVREGNVRKYMDLRSIFAKRSVAQNSFAAIASMRAAGSPESAPYTKAIMRDLGISNDDEIEKLLGKNPSYFAQMEVLTKKLYQNPVFYTELYDKPVNVERKGAALQAIGLMQDRDFYDSLLRSEAVLSVLLETMLQEQQQKVINSAGSVKR